ncbi:MAG: hypothetical protein NVS3B3_04440 [Aquirhabdus sp.]
MKLQITIKRSEGPINRCKDAVVVSTFENANSVLRQWSSTAPQGGGYDKCDFVIKDLDNPDFAYTGRYDLKHFNDEAANLKTHVLGFLHFVSGKACPSHMTQARYEAMNLDHYTDEDRANASILIDLFTQEA